MHLARLVLALAVPLVLAAPGWSEEEPPAPEVAPPGTPAESEDASEAPEAPVDVTAEARRVNGEGAPKPPSSFRPGHVSARALPADAIASTDDGGWQVQFPSRAPVATPTIHGGRVFVSGGFRSKEYYCLDAKTGALVWGLDLDDDGPSSAVVEDDVVVFNTESCTIFAVEAATGTMLWSHWLGDPLMSTPAVANGRVFTTYPASGRAFSQGNAANAPSAAGRDPAAGAAPPTSHVLLALDLKTGRILWQRWVDGDAMSAPVAVGDRLHLATLAGTVYEFSQDDGTIHSARRELATSAPVVADGRIFLTKRTDIEGRVREALVALDAAGRTLSAANAKDARYLDMEVQAGSTVTEDAEALDEANGLGGALVAGAGAGEAAEVVGQGTVSMLQAFQGSRVTRIGSFNYASMGDEVVCTDPATGETCWSVKLEGDLARVGGFLGTSPAAAGGALFVGTVDGRVLQIDAAKGTVAKTYRAGGPVRAQPIVHAGRIYVGTFDGRVVCIPTGNDAHTGWTAWGGNGQHTGVAAAPAKD